MTKRAPVLLTFALLLAPAFAGAKPGQRTARPLAHRPQATPVAERSANVDKPAAKPDRAASSDKGESSEASTTATTSTSGKTIKTKSYTFGAMDVEGKLKTPQLLYFLNRVKLELDMSAPDKRSFMKELVKSADDKNL
jgi:hypothetical protein